MEKKDKIAIELEIKDLLYSANNKINLATTLTEIEKSKQYIQGILDTREIIRKYIKE